MKRLKPEVIVGIVLAILFTAVIATIVVGSNRSKTTGIHGEELDILQSEDELTVQDKPAEPSQNNTGGSNSGAGAAGVAATENNQSEDGTSASSSANGEQVYDQNATSSWEEDQSEEQFDQSGEGQAEAHEQTDSQYVGQADPPSTGSDGVEPGHHENELPPIEFE